MRRAPVRHQLLDRFVLSADRPGGPRIRSLGIPVFLPSFMLGVGQGAVIPIVVLRAVELGASLPVAALVVALRGVGTMAFDLPSGLVVSRLGDGRSMLCSVVVLVAALLGCASTSTLLGFAACTFLVGCAWSVWLLARQSFVTEAMPPRLRGRALSTVGGMNRVGLFVGPFIAALTIQPFGLRGVFYLHAMVGVLAAAALVSSGRARGVKRPGRTPHSLRIRAMVREHRRTFLVLGFATMSVNLLRESRQVLLPLWAYHVGLSATSVAIIFGFSSALDMALFYPAGYASDRWGRRSVAIPCIALLAAGHLCLTLADSFETVCLVGLIMGLGNGLGSGIVMTLGADFSPTLGRANFLAVFRLLGDTGAAGGPAVVSAAMAVTGLGVTVGGIGVVGLACAVAVAVTMPESLRTEEQPLGRSGGSPGSR